MFKIIITLEYDPSTLFEYCVNERDGTLPKQQQPFKSFAMLFKTECRSSVGKNWPIILYHRKTNIQAKPKDENYSLGVIRFLSRNPLGLVPCMSLNTCSSSLLTHKCSLVTRLRLLSVHDSIAKRY